MFAWIWMVPFRVSEVSPSLAVTVWSRAVTVPVTSAGVPPWPRALPRTTIELPT